MTNREILLNRTLMLLSKGLSREIDCLDLGQEIWDAASEMTDYEDKNFRDYLQWLEANLDSLLNLDAGVEIMSRFLQDQIDLITNSLKDEKFLKAVKWKDSLSYFPPSSREKLGS